VGGVMNPAERGIAEVAGSSASRMPPSEEPRHKWVSRVGTLAGSLLSIGGGENMRYIAAWLLGVPLSVIAIWYVIGNTACG
jgi:hypothetical protein